MSGLSNLQPWQFNNVQRACNEAVREALFYGLDAGDLKRLLAECWSEVLREKAELGARELRA
jgi:hypothetical protein